MKKFFITIDTEGDNLWNWHSGQKINTENVKFLPRFQLMAEEYGFKPIWLSNYEMLSDSKYIDFICNVEDKKTGELGMHLHAWNNPPYYELNKVRDSQPYLIEYPLEIMRKKIYTLTEFIKKRTGTCPISHRAGRWAMNQIYFDLLSEFGYKIDCSYTPHVNWNKSLGCVEDSKGSDYTKVSEEPFYINTKNNKKILEIPMTIRIKHKMYLHEKSYLKNYAASIYHMFFGKICWLRPNGYNLEEMISILDEEKKNDYVMFMIHSSELMPGGSPTFRTRESIEKLYSDLKQLFRYASKYYCGSTFKEYINKV